MREFLPPAGQFRRLTRDRPCVRSGKRAAQPWRYRNCSCHSCRPQDLSAWPVWSSSPPTPARPAAERTCCARTTPHPARRALLRAFPKTRFPSSGSSDHKSQMNPSLPSFQSTVSRGSWFPDWKTPEIRRIFRPARARTACARYWPRFLPPCAADHRTSPSKMPPACFFQSRFPGR